MNARVSRELLALWLVAHHFGEKLPGYGHATGDQIADALVETFDLQFKPVGDSAGAVPNDMAEFATTWTIPTAVAKQDRPVRIGPCVYGRYPGLFVYKVYGELNCIGLKSDGQWHKYGDPFDSPQAAYETLLSTIHIGWGD